MTPTKRQIEGRAIECAEHYAATNGYAGDRVVVGLVLVGMAIGARLRIDIRRDLASGYDEEFPAETAVLDRWAERIES